MKDTMMIITSPSFIATAIYDEEGKIVMMAPVLKRIFEKVETATELMDAAIRTNFRVEVLPNKRCEEEPHKCSTCWYHGIEDCAPCLGCDHYPIHTVSKIKCYYVDEGRVHEIKTNG